MLKEQRVLCSLSFYEKFLFNDTLLKYNKFGILTLISS